MNAERADEAFEYCREIESFLCRKNQGHLVRIVGPAFEMVRGWAEQGIPLKVACRGIEQTCERLAAKGPRRRPVRIEFCEADVLDAFDDWRRAIGTGTNRVGEAAPPSKQSLAGHVERAVARLLAIRLNGDGGPLADAIAATLTALDELAAPARQARGSARAAIIARLAELDAGLMTAARAHTDPANADALRREANADLAPFAARMSEEATRRAQSVAYDRLLRESLNLPKLDYQ